MSDITQRLREHDDDRLYREADELMSEAADEIERLESQARELRAHLFELRDILNRRPALNAGTLRAYMQWTGEVYALDWLNALDERGGT